MPSRLKNLLKTVAATGALLVLCDNAWALRCGSKLIKEGMVEAQVIKLCGQPVSVRKLGHVLRPYIIKRPGGSTGLHSTQHVYAGFHQELAVSELLFNFGPHKLMRLIRFEGGRLTSIETAGYGHLEKKR
jgi:hypothetical protein